MGLTLLNLSDKSEPRASASGLPVVGTQPLPHGLGLPHSDGDGSNRVREAASPGLLFGQDPEGYRPLGPARGFGSALSRRDLNPPLQSRMQQVAYYLYLVNPLAHRIVEHTKNYVVGDGVTVKAEDPAVAEVLDRFWNDPVNRMDNMLPESVKELSIFGEQCWLAAVNPVSGRVRLGYLDPAEIEAIEWGELAVNAGFGTRGSEFGRRLVPCASVPRTSGPRGEVEGKVKTLRQALLTGLLFIACVAGLQVTYLLAQLSTSARRIEGELLETNRQAQATLLYSQAVLASVRGTTEAVRKGAVEQMGYYEAVGRRTSLALARLALLIDHTDRRVERITQAVEQTSAHANQTAEEIADLADSLREDLHGLSTRTTDFLDVSTRALGQVNERLSDARWDQIAEGLAESSQNTAQATANVAEAAGYIRDMLSPTKKSFWRRVLELLIPRPTLGVK